MKIVIHGLGRVGATLAYTVLLKGLASELTLIGRNADHAKGHALDLRHATAFTPRPTQVTSGNLDAAQGADLIALCASAPSPPDMRDRNFLADANAKLFAKILPRLTAAAPDAVLVVVSNPVDALTRLTQDLSGLPTGRVLGTGTLVDSLRFRELLSEEIDIHTDDLRAYILGEHGESQLTAFSCAEAGGEPIEHTPERDRLFEIAKHAGFEVFALKGYTNFAIASAAAHICEAIAFDTKRVMPVSTDVEGFHGARDVCLSLPAVVGRAGVTRVLHPTLNESEITAWKRSADSVRQVVERMRRAAAPPG
ncbi:MAG: lactate dehydrogenase [Planctomycetota bacterium]